MTHGAMTGNAGPQRAPRWGWWHRQRPVTRKSLRAGLLLLITGIVAVTAGVFTASATSSLGPHMAQYSTSVDHEVRLDLGPLGAVILDSPLPWPLGVTVVVKEIPAELASVATNPVTGLADDLAAYAQVFSQPEAAITDASRALVSDALGRTILVWSALLLVIAAARYASRGLLRREVGLALRQRGVVPIAVTLVCAVVALQAVAVARQPQLAGHTITALAGTPVEGLRMTGRMGQLVHTYGSIVLDVYEDNERFYDTVAANLHDAYDADAEPRRPDLLPLPSPEPEGEETTEDDPAGEEPEGDETADEAAGGPEGDETADEEGAAPTGAAEPTPTAGQPLPRLREPEGVTALLVSDLHCNVGMARVIAAAAERSGADLLIDAGDVVMSGTSVESYCVNAFAAALPDDLPAVVATGNHDSVTTADQLADAGYAVLDGRIIDVAGVRLLGDTDPTLTAVGEGTSPEREESAREMGERLADVACEARDEGDGVDMLVVHNPVAALDALERGCAPLTLSGHWHRREGPEVHGLGVRYVSSSAAGAVSSAPTIGPLQGTAEMTVLRVDPESGNPLSYRIIQITPAAEVALGPWYAFPRHVPDPDPVIGPGGDLLPATPEDE